MGKGQCPEAEGQPQIVRAHSSRSAPATIMWGGGYPSTRDECVQRTNSYLWICSAGFARWPPEITVAQAARIAEIVPYAIETIGKYQRPLSHTLA